MHANAYLKPLLFSLLFLLLASTLSAQHVEAPRFRKGDRVCFIGNSITHVGTYHEYIYLYYLTRQPNKPFSLFNVGISGDVAPGAIKRFEEDILIHQPNVATVMLGMNDVQRHLYQELFSPDSVLAKQQSALDNYVNNMDSLVARLQQNGIEAILFTPSIYEQDAQIERENLLGVNEALGYCAEAVYDLADKYRCSVVDFYGIMNRINAQMQLLDSSATLVGADRVHPGEVGHFVMAYTFLVAQEVPSTVARIQVDLNQGKISNQNCYVQMLHTDSQTVQLQYQPFSLPYPIDPKAKAALALVPFQDEMNQELLQIKGLKPGRYDLRINDKSITQVSAARLALGINLAQYPNSPQYQQAQQVAVLNHLRHKLVSDTLRTLKMLEYENLRALPKPLNLAEAQKVMDKKLEAMAHQPWHGWVKSQADKYFRLKPDETKYLERLAYLEEKVWQINKPTSLEISIVPLSKNHN